MIKALRLIIFFTVWISFTGCQGSNNENGEQKDESFLADEPETGKDQLKDRPACLQNLYYKNSLQLDTSDLRCKKATAAQIKMVDDGNAKKDQFLSQCYAATENSCWCDHLIRPNPNSIDSFRCTYGESQVHQFIHPDENTWPYAFEAVKIVEEFEDQQIFTQIIYNWWRPEPYNKNVGGSATRHPFGTSIDVRFESKDMQDQAFLELCKMRKEGRVRAIGYYASTALHFGIGDNNANTWGKSCP